ncbi:MAG: TrkH family potassium uptake protein, partial [Thermoplasmata archaeon]
MSDLKTILRDLGGIFIVIGLITIVALIVPLYFGEYYALPPLFLTALMFFAIGSLLYLIFKKAPPTNFKAAMVTAALAWFFISLIGCIPFLLIQYLPGIHMDFISAFFESMSGWTGTGLTMIDKENLLPFTLQFWRSLIQWVGGVGVIVLTLAILARPGTGSFVLYKSEAREQKTHPSIVSTVRTIWWIFLLYTIAGVIVVMIIGMLTADGMNPWQALNHCMTAIATGGFSVTDNSIAGFNTITQIAILILMLLGSIAFAAHYDLLKGRIKKFLSDAQFQAMILLIILGVTTLILINLNDPDLHYKNNLLLALKESGFQFISAITCTGFYSANIGNWTESAKLLLSLAMIIGGAAGSTAGGIKLFRAILLSKGVGWRIKHSIST